MNFLKSTLLLSMGLLSMSVGVLSKNAVANKELAETIDKIQVEEDYIAFADPVPDFLQKVRAKYHSKFKEEFMFSKLRFKEDIHSIPINEIGLMTCNFFVLETDSFEFFPFKVQKYDTRIEDGFLINLKKEKMGFHISHVNAMKYRNNGNASYFYDLSAELKRLYKLKTEDCEKQKDLRIKNIKKEEQLKAWEERTK